MSKEWLNELRTKMEDHTEDVPDGLWEDIRSELFEEDRHILGAAPTDIIAQSKKNTYPNFTNISYKIGSVAAVLAFVFFGIDHFFETNVEKENSQKNTLAGYPKKEIGFPQNSEEIEMNYKSFDQIDQFKNYTTARIDNEKLTENLFSERIDQIAKDFLNFGSQEQPKSSELTQQNQIQRQENTTNISDGDLRENDELLAINEFTKKPDLPKNKSNGSWMVSVLTGNASPNSSGEFPGYSTFNGSNMSVSQVFNSSGTDINPLTLVILANQNEEVQAKIKHKTPVTFGASVYYNIGKRWGIGTGITYTKLSSELHSGSDSNYIKSDQTIHYVGVPLQVNYNVIKKAGFTGYLTAGTLVEKSVSGNLKTKYVVENTVKDETQDKLNAKPTQISVNASAGLQLNITNRLGIYAEPGLGYHFKDNSSLNTIYKEKPLNFNLKFGLRLSLE